MPLQNNPNEDKSVIAGSSQIDKKPNWIKAIDSV